LQERRVASQERDLPRLGIDAEEVVERQVTDFGILEVTS
jgi:hypothetical protein